MGTKYLLGANPNDKGNSSQKLMYNTITLAPVFFLSTGICCIKLSSRPSVGIFLLPFFLLRLLSFVFLGLFTRFHTSGGIMGSFWVFVFEDLVLEIIYRVAEILGLSSSIGKATILLAPVVYFLDVERSWSFAFASDTTTCSIILSQVSSSRLFYFSLALIKAFSPSWKNWISFASLEASMTSNSDKIDWKCLSCKVVSRVFSSYYWEFLLNLLQMLLMNVLDSPKFFCRKVWNFV